MYNQFRALFISLLDDDYGVNADSYNKLCNMLWLTMLAPDEQEDYATLRRAVRAQDGRFYLPRQGGTRDGAPEGWNE